MFSPPIPSVVQQHAEEASFLRTTRSYLVTAAHIQLHDLARADERLAADLNGLTVAGDEGSKVALTAIMEDPDVGEFFTAAVLLIEDRNTPRLEWLLDLAEALASGRQGVISAFGWVPAASLQGLNDEGANQLLTSCQQCEQVSHAGPIAGKVLLSLAITSSGGDPFHGHRGHAPWNGRVFEAFGLFLERKTACGLRPYPTYIRATLVKASRSRSGPLFC